MHLLDLTKEQATLINDINEEIINAEMTAHFDNRYGMEDATKAEAISIGLEEFLWDYRELNFDYISQLEYELRENIVESHKDELVDALDLDDEVWDLQSIIDDFFFDYHPHVYFDPKDVFGGETVNSRLILHSNYDCMNSHWFESQGGYSYENSYFGAVVDALNLCPNKLVQYMLEHDIRFESGKWPTKLDRRGNELVDYEEFLVELENNSGSAVLLTIPINIDLYQLYEAGGDINSLRYIQVPKGSFVGFYSSMVGGGSMIDTPLLDTLTIDLQDQGETQYDTWSLVGDNQGYSMKRTYGVGNEFFADAYVTNSKDNL